MSHSDLCKKVLKIPETTRQYLLNKEIEISIIRQKILVLENIIMEEQLELIRLFNLIQESATNAVIFQKIKDEITITSNALIMDKINLSKLQNKFKNLSEI
jgi:hypothetical protein